jgi:hypothetical protein
VIICSTGKVQAPRTTDLTLGGNSAEKCRYFCPGTKKSADNFVPGL